MNIQELCKVHSETDKAALGYDKIYDQLFALGKETVEKLLEIGIHKGDSLRVWRDFFPNGRIYGWDKNPKTMFKDDRIATQLVDHDKVQDVDKALNVIGGNIDIIIDDGSHYMDSQQILLSLLWKALKPGGLYIIEDLHTSTVPGEYGVGLWNETTFHVLQRLQKSGTLYSGYIEIRKAIEIQKAIESVSIHSIPAVNYPPWNTFILGVITKGESK